MTEDESKNVQHYHQHLSTREGRFIVGKALQIAIEVLSSAPLHSRDHTSIADMVRFRDVLFWEYSQGRTSTILDKEEVDYDQSQNHEGMEWFQRLWENDEGDRST